ncbi:MAG: DUF72 domain-containing protein [Myxococcales bacterium]|nr:DUF72 domain-containing protein [Myxococcales bacterium]
MRLYGGSSGYSYKEWKGPFYPDKCKPEAMLAFYAERLTTVEINNTFYRMPKTEVLENWAAAVPDDFRFVIKASRRITHQMKLSLDAKDSVDYLFSRLTALGSKLGPVLFQLPPYLRKDLPLLQGFLEMLPDAQVAIEFRSRSWFDDEVFAALRARGVALCVTDWEDPSKVAPLEKTASFAYLRLRKEVYTDEELVDWIARMTAKGWDSAYVFFKHEDDGAAPKLAMRMGELHAEAASR